jgi:hypothetical protein
VEKVVLTLCFAGPISRQKFLQPLNLLRPSRWRVSSRHDDLGMVPAFNMLGRGNRLHGEGFGMMQNLVDPNAGWGYALQCSPSVRAGGKVFGGLPILPDKTGEYKATYNRRRLTENGLSSIGLESRFYAVLSKAAASGLASNPRRSKSREPKRPKGRESVRISRKDRNGVLTPGRLHNERIHRQK